MGAGDTEKGSLKRRIYFAQGAPGTPIKIGVATDFRQRFKTIQTYSSEKLRLLVLVPGDEAKERALHEYFSKYRLQGEWFEPSPEILAIIEKLRSDGEQELERLITALRIRILQEAGYSEKDKRHRSPKIRLAVYEALGGWEQALRDGSKEIRLRAYEETGQWETALRDKSVVVRRAAYEKTGRWEDALKDPHPEARLTAYRRLKRWEEALNDPDEEVKILALAEADSERQLDLCSLWQGLEIGISGILFKEGLASQADLFRGFSVDLFDFSKEHPRLYRQMLNEVIELIKAGKVKPVPIQDVEEFESMETWDKYQHYAACRDRLSKESIDRAIAALEQFRDDPFSKEAARFLERSFCSEAEFRELPL